MEVVRISRAHQRQFGVGCRFAGMHLIQEQGTAGPQGSRGRGGVRVQGQGIDNMQVARDSLIQQLQRGIDKRRRTDYLCGNSTFLRQRQKLSYGAFANQRVSRNGVDDVGIRGRLRYAQNPCDNRGVNILKGRVCLVLLIQWGKSAALQA